MVVVAAPDLPVLWWVFWLVVMAVGVFGAFAWWLTREALREDLGPREPHEHDGSHPSPGENDPEDPTP